MNERIKNEIRIQALEKLGAEDWEIKGLLWSDIIINKSNTLISESVFNAKVSELIAAYPLEELRKKRNQKLAETDWWVLPDRTSTQAQKDYRKALRDLPATAEPKLENGQLTNVTWPEKPE